MTLSPAEINNLACAAVKALRDTTSYQAQVAIVEIIIRQSLTSQFEKLVVIVPASAAQIHGGLLNLSK